MCAKFNSGIFIDYKYGKTIIKFEDLVRKQNKPLKYAKEDKNMNIKAIALASVIGLSVPTIADITLNYDSASAMPTDFVRPTGAFMDNSENWVVWLKLDEFGNYTYEAQSRKTGSSLTLKNASIKGNSKRYTYTFRNGSHKYIIAHRPKDPSIIRLTVVNPQGDVILNRLMERVGNDWDV